MNGYEICRALRQLPDFASVPIIAQTGWGQKKDKEKAAEAGFDYHLIKPTGFQALENLISEIASEKA